MSELFRSPLSQVESAAGVPVSGAKAYFYAAGTQNDLAVYQDSGLITQHAQPVVADSSGIWPAIYLSTTTYKVVYKDASDVIIKTFDNVNTTAASNTVSDGAFRIQSAGDATKQAAFDASAITSGQTRTISLPNKSGTLAMTSDISSQADNVFRITDDGDATKQIAFQASSITTGNTRTLTVQDSDGTIALLNVEAQTLTGGANVTVKDLGNLSGASITPTPGNRPKQKITNNGAGSILPGSTAGDYILEVINTTGAGAITTTGWTLKGDSFDTTTTSKFLCSCHVSSDQKVMIITKTA